MNRYQETAVAFATSAAMAAGPTAEVFHQPEIMQEAELHLGAAAAQSVMGPAAHPRIHTEIRTATLVHERPHAPHFSDSPEATTAPTATQQNQFESVARRLSTGGFALRLNIASHSSDEARSTAADRSAGGMGIHDEANDKLARTTLDAVTPLYQKIAEDVSGFPVVVTGRQSSEIVHPELAAKTTELAHEMKTSPIGLMSTFNAHPERLTQAARNALTVLRHDRNVEVELTGTKELPLLDDQTAVPAPRKKEPAHTLQEGINQLPAQLSGPSYNDFTYGAGKRSSGTVGILSAQSGPNQTPATGSGIKQPRPQNYSGAAGVNMPRNGRGRGGNKY